MTGCVDRGEAVDDRQTITAWPWAARSGQEREAENFCSPRGDRRPNFDETFHPPHPQSPPMLLLAEFTLSLWWAEAWYELSQYAANLSRTQWGIVSAVVCALGFVMLRGNVLRI